MKTAKRILVVLATVALLVGALAVSAFAADGDTVKYTFADYTAGTQYAKNEVHKLDDNVTVTTTECHFTSELRVYSSTSHDGYFIVESTNVITAFACNAGNKVDTLNIYASVDGKTYTTSPVATISVTATSYKDYSTTIDATGAAGYKYLKVDVAGTQQVRIKTMSLTTIASEMTDAQKVEQAIKNLDFTSTNFPGVAEVELPTTSIDGVIINWTSSDESIATISGNKVVFNNPAEDDTVTLTAIAVCGEEQSEKKEFDITFSVPTLPGNFKEGVKYHLSTVSGGNTYYYAGTVSSGKGATTTDINSAATIYVELDNVNSGYYIYMLNGETRTYLYTGTTSTSMTANSTKTLMVYDEAVGGLKSASSGRFFVFYSTNKEIRTYASSSITETNTAFTLVAAPELNDAGNVEKEIANLDIPEIIFKKGTEVVLTAGTDANVTWALNTEFAGVSIVDGKLVVTDLPETGSATATLVATVTSGAVTETREFVITIKILTQAEIVDMAFALASGADLANGPYTLTGVISSIDTAYDSGYKNITVSITVYNTAGEAKTFKCYRMKGEGANVIKVGDEITATGEITNYGGIIEFKQGCTLDKYPNPVKFSGVSLNIANDIDIRFYATLPEGFDSENTVVEFEFNGEKTTATWEMVDGRMMFVFQGINPAQMGDIVTAKITAVYADATYEATKEMSVKKYYQMAQAYEGTKDDTALMTLLSDLLVYGAKAQTFIGDTDALVTEGLTLTPSQDAAIPESNFAATGDVFKSVALELGSDITVVIKVALEGGDVVTVNFNGTTTTYAQADLTADADGYYTIKFANIKATAYGMPIVAEVNGNTLTYSVNSYISEKANDENANLAALVKALNNYGMSAIAYQNKNA